MISFKAFEVLVGIVTGSRAREKRSHEEFMEFFQELVRIVPDDVSKAFGRVHAPVMLRGGSVGKDYQIELTVADVIWWRNVMDEGGRFIQPISEVQRSIWDRMNQLVIKNSMTDEDRSKLIDVMNSDRVTGQQPAITAVKAA